MLIKGLGEGSVTSGNKICRGDLGGFRVNVVCKHALPKRLEDRGTCLTEGSLADDKKKGKEERVKLLKN